MSHKQAIAIYSQLFNHRFPNDEGFYKNLFITPVLESALLSTLRVNSESLNSMSGASANDAQVLEDVFIVGIKYLSDAMDYPDLGIDENSNTLRDIENSAGISGRSSTSSRPLGGPGSLTIPFDDIGEDITSLSGKKSAPTTHRPSLRDLDEGDDITTLNGQVPPSSPRKHRRGSSVSINSSSSLPFQPQHQSLLASSRHGSSPDIRDYKTASPRKSTSQRPGNVIGSTKEFAGIDDDLRLELIVNITRVLQVWFQNILATNKHNYNALRSLKNGSNGEFITNQSGNIIYRLFKLPGTNELLTDAQLFGLLTKMKWFLQQSVDKIDDQVAHQDNEEGTAIDYKSLLVMKEFIFLIYDILRTLFHSILTSVKHNSENNDIIIIKSLLFTFYKVDFSGIFDRILSITSNRQKQAGQSSEDSSQEPLEFEPPKIRLSYETLMKLIVIVGSLSNVPSDYLLVNKSALSSDITTMDSESPNVYENALTKLKHFPNLASFQGEINSKVIPILAMNFNYFFNLAPDLLVYQIKNTSFFNWITANKFNDNLYLNYDTVSSTTNLSTNTQNISYLHSDPYVQEIISLYERRQLLLQDADESEDKAQFVTSEELLPLTLLLFTYSRNPQFSSYLTRQFNFHNHKIEDLLNKDIKSIELLEAWLCLSSYVFQYQYRSTVNKHVTRLTLLTLLRLTSPKSVIKVHKDATHPGEAGEETETQSMQQVQVHLVDNLSKYQINEFKWKLCHHRLPVIPNNIVKEGFKTSLLYIIDCLQVLLRFNLTKRLNLENYKLSVTIIYQTLIKFRNVMNKDAHDKDVEYLKQQLSNYSWIDLYKTLMNVLSFIYKQYGKMGSVVKSLVEEIFLVFELVLSPEFDHVIQLNAQDFKTNTQKSPASGNHLLKAVNYELIYELLLNFELVSNFFNDIVSDSGHFTNLQKCFEYLTDEFQLRDMEINGEEQPIDGNPGSGTNTSSDAIDTAPDAATDTSPDVETTDTSSNNVDKVTQKFDLLHADVDSPELVNKISGFKGQHKPESDDGAEFNYKDTLKYYNKAYDSNGFENGTVAIEIFNIMYETKWSLA